MVGVAVVVGVVVGVGVGVGVAVVVGVAVGVEVEVVAGVEVVKVVLVIMLSWNGQFINHFQTVEDHGILNLTYCYEWAKAVRENWENKEGVEIVFIGCPGPWRET